MSAPARDLVSAPPGPASVLQITDLHLLERPGAKLLGIDTAASLEAVLDAALAERQPAAMLVTGDIAHEPTKKDRLPNAPELLQCLSKMASVKALVFGHAHQALDRRHGPLPLLGTPSTCFQFRPRSDAFSIDDAAPGHRWLHLLDDGRVGTEVGRAQGFPMTIDLSRRKPAAA